LGLKWNIKTSNKDFIFSENGNTKKRDFKQIVTWYGQDLRLICF
jgi:hypothetical protein